jgi:hypothetical protein
MSSPSSTTPGFTGRVYPAPAALCVHQIAPVDPASARIVWHSFCLLKALSLYDWGFANTSCLFKFSVGPRPHGPSSAGATPMYLTWRALSSAHQAVVPVNFAYPSFFFNLITPQWVAQARALSLWLYLRSSYALVSFSAQSPLRGLASFWERHRTSSLCFNQAGFAALAPSSRLRAPAFTLTGGPAVPLAAHAPAFTFSLPAVRRALAWLRCDYGGDARCAHWLWVTSATRRRVLLTPSTGSRS